MTFCFGISVNRPTGADVVILLQISELPDPAQPPALPDRPWRKPPTYSRQVVTIIITYTYFFREVILRKKGHLWISSFKFFGFL